MIKLSQFTRGRTFITEDKEDPKEIYPVLDVTHVMRRDTTPKIIPETKAPPTRSLTRRGIMLTLLKRMNQKGKEQKKNPQVMRNVYFNIEGFNP